MKMPFYGSGTAIITPFNKNGINYNKMKELIEFQIENNTDAIIVAGTTGEASTLSDSEHLELFSFCVDVINKRVPVIAGTGSNDTAHAVLFAKEAQKRGADAILSVTPYYNKANSSGLYKHFESIAAAIDLPIILYNVPSRTGLNFPIDTLKKLSKIDNITALKEASGNISYLAEIISTIPDLYIYSGNDDLCVPAMSLGAIGVISVAANIIPEKMHDMCKQYLSGNCKGATALQLELLPLIKALFSEVNPIPVKYAMNLMGMDVGDTRLPLGKPDTECIKKLERELKNLDLLKIL